MVKDSILSVQFEPRKNIYEKVEELLFEDPILFTKYVAFCHKPWEVRLTKKESDYLYKKGLKGINRIPLETRAVVMAISDVL